MTNSERTYFESGEIRTEHWWLHGKCHRANGPASIFYYLSGNVQAKRWYLNGTIHRADGPAVMDFDEPGKILYEEWYLNGKLIKPQEWLKENNYSVPLTKDQQTELILTFG